MTNDEFINALSPKAKQIIESYACKRKKNRIIICLNEEHTKVDVSDPNQYIIEVRQTASLYDMEYRLLHEFFHCVQMEEGFSYVSQTSVEYGRIASAISYVVLDLDVNNRLEEVGYPYNPDGLKNILDTTWKLTIMAKTDATVERELHKPNEFFYRCAITAFIRINYNNADEIGKLLNLLKQNAPDIYKAQAVIYNTVKEVGFDTPKKAYTVFKTLIRELRLENYIQIS